MKETLINKIHLKSRQDLKKLATILVDLLTDRSLILLVGDVGCGKTSTVSEIASLLKMSEAASPSFAIHHQYKGKDGSVLDHVDLYRLQSEDDLESTGFWDLFQNSKGRVLVEWADRVADSAWPMGWQIYRVVYSKGKTPEERSIAIFELSH